jgi:hypothetical protein
MRGAFVRSRSVRHGARCDALRAAVADTTGRHRPWSVADSVRRQGRDGLIESSFFTPLIETAVAWRVGVEKGFENSEKMKIN